MKRILLVHFVYATLSFGAFAQPHFGGPVIYPEKLHEDLEIMRGLVHQAHPDPYRYCTHSELDRLFDALRDSIRVPIRTDEFQAMLVPVFQRIGDANLAPELDLPTFKNLMNSTAVLPLKVRVIEGELYVDEELRGFRSLPVGSRIRAINGLPAHRILDQVGALLLADGANESLRWKLVERYFPWLLLRATGYASGFKLDLELPAGGVIEETLFAITGEEIERSRKPAAEVLFPWSSVWETESGTLWVTMRTLDKDAIESSGQSVERFLGDMLKELKDGRARNLVIDLREAGGRELGMAEVVFATIAREPFRVVQGMSVRSDSPPEGYGFIDPQPEHYASVQAHYLPHDLNGTAFLRPDDDRLVPVQPQARAFDGKVYVVCDGGTRDAAAALVMLAKRHGRARIIGEETGTNAYSFTGGRELLVTAPNSRVRLRIPLVRYLPDGTATGAMDHGEMPHHPVQQRPADIAKGRDTVKRSLLETIKELQ